MNIVCFGDSITRGYGVPKSGCWVELLKSMLSAEIINKGINGDTTAGMLSRCFTDIIKNSPTHAIIMGGTNDFLAGRCSSSVFDNILMIVNECKSNNIKPIIAIQPPVAAYMAEKYWASGVDYNKVNNSIRIYRDAAVEYASKNNVLIIDFFKSFAEYMGDKIEEFLMDGIHPSPSGHKLMAQILSEIVF
jgi:acyl-CoA thioesterase-1